MSVRLLSLCSPTTLMQLACALAFSCSAVCCSAESDVIPPPEPESQDIPSVPAVALPAGYWMVGTHESPQSFDRGCPQFRPCVKRFDCACGCRARQSRFSTMCQSLQPGIPICIYVHGSFVSPKTVAQQSAMTYRWLNSASCNDPVQVIHFTWPSSRPLLIPTIKCDVNLLGRRAARNGWYLAELIRHLPPESPICLIGHSHGTRLVASALHLMGGGKVQGVTHPWSRPEGRRIRTVFAAAAMRHDWLNPGERYGRALCSTECVINLKNKHDGALHFYPLRHPFSGHSMGSTGLTRRDRRELRGWSHRVQDYDVTRMIGHQHMWPRYLQYPSLAWLIRNYVYFPDVQTVCDRSTVHSRPLESVLQSSSDTASGDTPPGSPAELSLPSS